MAYTFPFPLVNGLAADATQVMSNLNVLLGAVNLQLAKDGSVALQNNLPMNNFRLNGLSPGAAAGDSVEYDQYNAGLAAAAALVGTTYKRVTAVEAIATGGTGATTGAAALTNLGIGTSGLHPDAYFKLASDVVGLAQGGTGATNALAALGNLGGVGVSAMSLASPGYIRFAIAGVANAFSLMWGTATAQGDTSTTVTYPTPFTSFSVAVVSGSSQPIDTAAQAGSVTTSTSTTGFTFYTAQASSGAFGTAWWIAGGV